MPAWCRSTRRKRRRRSSRTDAIVGKLCAVPVALCLRASPSFPAPSPIRSRPARSSNGRPRSSKSSSRTRSTRARRRSTSRSKTAAASSFASATTAPGMSRDDAVLSLERHATSKIRTAQRSGRRSELRLSRRSARRDLLRLAAGARDSARRTGQGRSFAPPAAPCSTSRMRRGDSGTTVQRRATVLQRAGATQVPARRSLRVARHARRRRRDGAHAARRARHGHARRQADADACPPRPRLRDRLAAVYGRVVRRASCSTSTT